MLLIVPGAVIAWFVLVNKKEKPLRDLPYFGPRHSSPAKSFVVPAFTFTNQFGGVTTQSDVSGKVYVAEFFFTTCRSICPIMNRHLDRVYQQFGSDPDFLILSHTVDPATDSVAVLKQYADQHGVHNKSWLFLTGSEHSIFRIARKGYLLADETRDSSEFVHTQNFALVDRDRHIRGFYDGTDSADVQRLLAEIPILLNEKDSAH